MEQNEVNAMRGRRWLCIIMRECWVRMANNQTFYITEEEEDEERKKKKGNYANFLLFCVI